ncbi:MAG: hypothetical protein M3P06_17270 [Acidobacteriota bacterium]|nr:hypothetical protein [Acidobacteriota bacterium]
MDTSDHFKGLGDYLPNYVCGAIWLLDLGLLAAFRLTASHLRHNLAQLANAVDILRVPDIVVGFFLIVVGVVAPYAIAAFLNPLSVAVANLLLHHLGPARLDLETANVAEAEKRAGGLYGSVGEASPELTLLPFLEHRRSAVVPSLRFHYRNLYIQTRLILPIGVLVGLIAYGVAGQGLFAFLVGATSAIIAIGAAGYANNATLRVWHTRVLFAFLASTGDITLGARQDRRSTHEEP